MPGHKLAWYSVASDLTGLNLVAVVNGGGIWTSTASTPTWTNQTTSGTASTQLWAGVACDSTGARIAAASTGVSSNDKGDVWTNFQVE